MNRLETLIESLRAPGGAAGKTALKHLGFFSCASQLDIKHVPFYEPCIILVLAGRKVLFEGQTPVTCEAGAVPTAEFLHLRAVPQCDLPVHGRSEPSAAGPSGKQRSRSGNSGAGAKRTGPQQAPESHRWRTRDSIDFHNALWPVQ
jgi:hypothetical protein